MIRSLALLALAACATAPDRPGAGPFTCADEAFSDEECEPYLSCCRDEDKLNARWERCWLETLDGVVVLRDGSDGDPYGAMRCLVCPLSPSGVERCGEFAPTE